MPALKARRRQPTSDADLARMRGVVRESAQDRPGVYRMLSPDGEVVYVGKSKRVRSRLLSYFRCAYPEDKGARILREASTIDWEYTPSEFAALLTELRAIKKLRPRFNVAMKRDARHYAFIKLSRGTAPKLMVVRGAGSEDGGVYYGPFVGAQRIGEAVRELSDALSLRDCSLDQKMYFADQEDLFGQPRRTPGCIRHEVRKCLGPCIAACTVNVYMERVAMARAFLEGADDGPIERLRDDMQLSSDRMEFERAASLRDKLHRLEELREQFGRLRFAVETLTFLYTVRGHEGDDRVYLIRRGCVRAEIPTPKTDVDERSVKDLVQSVYSVPERKSSSVPTHEIDELLLLSSWFRRNPGELDNTRRAERLQAV
jgi:excinuclease ABC subunit C